MLEQAPPFMNLEDAIAWGRLRAHRVVVRLGDDSTTIYSAGSERLTWQDGEPIPEWPPQAQLCSPPFVGLVDSRSTIFLVPRRRL
jgi:hypothetical protein